MIIKPWLWLPPKWAHDLSPWGIKLISFISSPQQNLNWGEQTWRIPHKKELHFKNPLGLAGGVDKNGENILAWQNLNAGFIEVGTITPLPQKPNPGKIIDRHLETLSIWNKMGFPSLGRIFVKKKLLKIKNKIDIPLFINIGKNRITPNEKAASDYSLLLKEFCDLADAFVINISSPNTQGLRNLLSPDSLNTFLSEIMDTYNSLKSKSDKIPFIFIKLSPDIDPALFDETLHICLKHDIDGFILTNTTLSRDKTPQYSSEGGVSGLPLKELSLLALKKTKQLCLKQNCKKMIISVGGVMTADDVFERIREGADLVQVYSALVFEGPTFFRKVAQIAKQAGTKRSNPRKVD